MKTSRVLSNVPWAELRAARPAARAQQNDVAGSDLHAGFLFPRLHVLDVDRRPRLEVLDALQARDVDQNSARDDALLQVVDAELGAALVGVDVGARVTVVGLILVQEVTERVD